MKVFLVDDSAIVLEKLAAMISGIDYFKAVNDACGHPFGDHVLKELGKIMERALRSTDRLFRYGGDEFLALLPGNAPEEARQVMARFCEAVRAHTFAQGEVESKITVSVGSAFYPFHAVERAVLIRLADEAFYEAKNSGRDRAVCLPCQGE